MRILSTSFAYFLWLSDNKKVILSQAAHALYSMNIASTKAENRKILFFLTKVKDLENFQPKAKDLENFQPKAKDLENFQPKAKDLENFQPKAKDLENFQPKAY